MYRTTLILRDLEEMSYEEIAEVLQISLGTVKSRLTRGRAALRKRLAPYVQQAGPELGLESPGKLADEEREDKLQRSHSQFARGDRTVEVMS